MHCPDTSFKECRTLNITSFGELKKLNFVFENDHVSRVSGCVQSYLAMHMNNNLALSSISEVSLLEEYS